MPSFDGDAALKMRQTIHAAGIVPAPASEELLALLQELRPWANEGAVATRLRNWAARHWGEGALTPGGADGAAEVAALLSGFGRATNSPDDRTALWVTDIGLRRVAHERSPTGSDPVTDYVVGYPPSTMRRWRKTARDTAGDGYDDGGLSIALERIQREHDLAGLVQKGYTLPNARAWLQRNRGKHAREAPPPRRRPIDASHPAKNEGG